MVVAMVVVVEDVGWVVAGSGSGGCLSVVEGLVESGSDAVVSDEVVCSGTAWLELVVAVGTAEQAVRKAKATSKTASGVADDPFQALRP